jgi:hypothetical protein
VVDVPTKYMAGSTQLETTIMRSVFASVITFIIALALLIAPAASGNAATALHRRQHAVVPPAPDAGHGAGQAIAPNRGVATPGYAVPGWSDESTRQWMGQYDSCKSIHCP